MGHLYPRPQYNAVQIVTLNSQAVVERQAPVSSIVIKMLTDTGPVILRQLEAGVTAASVATDVVGTQLRTASVQRHTLVNI